MVHLAQARAGQAIAAVEAVTVLQVPEALGVHRHGGAVGAEQERLEQAVLPKPAAAFSDRQDTVVSRQSSVVIVVRFNND